MMELRRKGWVSCDMLKLTTERLLMIPCSIHLARAMIFNRSALKTFLLADVPEGWPSDELKAFLPFYIEELEKNPALLGWGVWILLEKSRKIVVGDAGFKGLPDKRDSVEIGYGVHPSFRNKGYAYEAAQALADWAFSSENRVSLLRAECNDDNLFSMKVLEKLGMQQVDREGKIMKWELRRT